MGLTRNSTAVGVADDNSTVCQGTKAFSKALLQISPRRGIVQGGSFPRIPTRRKTGENNPQTPDIIRSRSVAGEARRAGRLTL
jgi:hypothetical protein